jgi:hypothetical protein
LQWFADRSPLLANLLGRYQDENGIEPLNDIVELSDSETPPARPSYVPKPKDRPWPQDEIKTTKFTQEDCNNFIQYAAARPSGMEPTGTERAVEVWEAFAKKVSLLQVPHTPSLKIIFPIVSQSLG